MNWTELEAIAAELGYDLIDVVACEPVPWGGRFIKPCTCGAFDV